MADRFLDTASSGGTHDGTTTAFAWRSIQYPLSGVDPWISTNDTGSVLATGDTLHIKDDHDETWDTAHTSRVIVPAMGSTTTPVVIKKDDGTYWTPTGGKPIIRLFNSTLARFDFSVQNIYLEFRDIDFRPVTTPTSLAGDPLWRLSQRNIHIKFVNCDMTAFPDFFNFIQGGTVVMENCNLDGTGHNSPFQGISPATGKLILRSCTINGVSRGFNLSSNRNSYIEAYDTVFSNNTNADVAFGSGANLFFFGRNVDFQSTTMFNPGQSSLGAEAEVRIQDFDDNPRLSKVWRSNGTVEVKESDLDTGGADTIIEATPNNRCLDFSPLKLFEFAVWAPNGVSRTYKVRMKGENWSTLPTVSELVFEVGYYDTASSSSRTFTASADTLSATGAYEDFSVSGISPSEDGYVILRGWLKVYESGTPARTIQVNVRPPDMVT